METRNKVWRLLTDEEKSCLNLSINMKKSSWEVGEIMKRSHYKLLEIQKRSEHFLRIFQIHFQKYNNQLIPDSLIELDPVFCQYMEKVILGRLNSATAAKQIPREYNYHKTNLREDEIIKHVQLLKEMAVEREDAKDLLNIILDYDRWHNRRILPEPIQEPSAFKRRNKARELKQIEFTRNLKEITFDHVVSNYKVSKNEATAYALMFQEEVLDEFYALPIKQSKQTLEDLSKVFIFIFDINDLETLNQLGELILTLPRKGTRNCKEGLKFWSKFRGLARKSLNYSIINNINPNRKNYIKELSGLKTAKEYSLV